MNILKRHEKCPHCGKKFNRVKYVINNKSIVHLYSGNSDYYFFECKKCNKKWVSEGYILYSISDNWYQTNKNITFNEKLKTKINTFFIENKIDYIIM